MRGTMPQAVLEVQAEWEAETARLREQLAIAVKALEFYANSRNLSKDSQEYGSEMSDYIVMWKDMREINQATRCAGEKATEALAQIKDMEK